MYMMQVMVLLQFQRANREGNCFLYLGALEKLCTYFFAYNQLDYAKNIPEYIAPMHSLENGDLGGVPEGKLLCEHKQQCAIHSYRCRPCDGAPEQSHQRPRRNIRNNINPSDFAQNLLRIQLRLLTTDKSTFLASNATKDCLTLYQAQQLIDKSTVKAVIVTHQSVMANYDCQAITGVSTQEEADTLMILHAVEVAASGATVHVHRTLIFFSWLSA